MAKELSNEELQQSCIRSDIWCLLCAQDYNDTLDDVIDNNPDMNREDTGTKETAMGMMLEENVDFGELAEDLDTDDNHPERMEARWDILDELAERWVAGKYSGKKEKEIELCQKDCTSLVKDWAAVWGED